MSEGLRGLQLGNIGNCRTRSDIDEHLLAGEHAVAAVIEGDLDGFRRHET
jgi:hypothetical protein